MDRETIEAAEAAVHPNFPKTEAILIVELDGAEADVSALFTRVEEVCNEARASEIQIARTAEQRARFWQGRKAAFAAMGRVSPSYYVQDGVIPRTRLPEVLSRIRDLSERSGLKIGNVFHAGDGNLHPLVCYDERIPGQADLAQEVASEILTYCLDADGSNHRRARRGRRQGRAPAEDVQRERPRHDAARAVRVRSRLHLQPGQGVSDAATVRRGARAVQEASGRGGGSGGARLMPGATSTALLDRLAAQAGPGAAVRAGGGDDAVDGVQPRLVAAPGTGEGVAATLAWASAEGLSVRVSGGATKQQWGAPRGTVDVLLSTARLSRILEHRHGDLTATVEAGAPLGSVNAALGVHGQRLPWDPPWPEQATIGGIVATNDSGPRRHGHGAPRDSIIGVTMARMDGRTAKAGGIVVKNVAGYDLARLLTGSFGCLGVILTATFKLAPAPPASRTVHVTVDSLEAAAPVAADIAASSLTPTAIEVAWGPAGLLVRFESVEASVVQQADAACAIVGGERRFRRARRRPGAGGLGGGTRRIGPRAGTLVKLSTVPAELFATLAWLRDRAAADGLEMAAAGRAGLGVVDVRLDGPPEAQAGLVAVLRERLPAGRGSAVIRRGGPELRRRVDSWGPIGDGMRVMMAIKRQFDPAALLNPGRGPGGL